VLDPLGGKALKERIEPSDGQGDTGKEVGDRRHLRSAV
jgi:hypothetical protein